MISVKIGWDEDAIGRIYKDTLEGPLKVGGDTVRMNLVIQQLRRDYDTDLEFLRDLPRIMRSRMWAEMEADNYG